MMSLRGKYRQSGLTLIELMIAIFIISIIGMVAVPSYQNSLIRSKVGSDLPQLDPVKTNIQVFFARYRGLPVDNETAGLPEPEKIKGRYLEKITILGAGPPPASKGKGKAMGRVKKANEIKVVMTYNASEIPELEGNNEIIFTVKRQGGRLVWDCKTETVMQNQYRPTECQSD